MTDAGSIALAIVLPFLALCLYLVPGLVAWDRKHPDRVSIWLLNIFLGWTFVGWVVALVWAAKSFPKK